MGISAEFARYKSKLANVQWAVSALTESEVVFSLWKHRMDFEPGGAWTYRDSLSRWAGNVNGNKLFAEHLRIAIAQNRPVRLVMATTDNIPLIEQGGDGSKANNKFKAWPDRVGQITQFDGNEFVIFFPLPTG